MRRIYHDTSLLVAALIHEVGTAAAHRTLLAVEQHPWQISSWVVAELASALAINCRRGVINRGELDQTWRRFERLQTGRLQLLELAPPDVHLAARLCLADAPPLRAGDALHLALCQRHNTGTGAAPGRRPQPGSGEVGSSVHDRRGAQDGSAGWPTNCARRSA